MPGIRVGVITEAGGAHLTNYFASLAQTVEVDAVTLCDPSGAPESTARQALGEKLPRHRRCVAVAGPIYGETVGWTVAASGNPPGEHALEGHRLEPRDFTHHPCLGLDRNPPYPAVGGEQSVNRQALDELKQQITSVNFLF